MDVRLLRSFVAVAEEGSIHGGARRMLIAQPALSQALRRLERELGGPLFLRSHRGIELTSAGSTLLEHARRILGYLDAAVENVRQVADGDRPVLHIGLVCGRVAAADLTGPIVAAFRRAQPALIIEVRELSFTGQVDAVLDGTVDLAIVRGPYLHDDLQMVPLFSEPLVLALGAEHPLADRPAIAVRDVLDEPMLEAVRTRREWRDFWHLAELRNERSRRAVPTGAPTLSEAQLALMADDAVAAVAASAWRMGMADPLLRAIPMPDAPRSQIGVGLRRGDTRPEVWSFVRTAREVTEMMIESVPDGELCGQCPWTGHEHGRGL